MIRNVIERLALFALPFALYYAYLLLLQIRPSAPARPHPWTLLTIVGLSLFALSFLVWRVADSEPITGTYVAPHVVNGKIVPGYVRPAETKP